MFSVGARLIALFFTVGFGFGVGSGKIAFSAKISQKPLNSFVVVETVHFFKVILIAHSNAGKSINNNCLGR